MTTKAIQPETISSKLISRWEQLGQKLVSLADEIPENKFDYRPTDGVRTLAEVLRHVAFWNLYVADRVRGKKGDKKQILNALRESNTAAVGALMQHKSGLSPDIAEMLVTFIEHNCEHYGQLVVYARMNGIVPPASRG